MEQSSKQQFFSNAKLFTACDRVQDHSRQTGVLYNLPLRHTCCFKYTFEIDSGKSYYLTKMAISEVFKSVGQTAIPRFTLIQHCKVRENNKIVFFQGCEEHYAYVTDGSVNWKISSSYKSSGRFSSPSAKNVGNGGFLLQSLQVGNLLSLT